MTRKSDAAESKKRLPCIIANASFKQCSKRKSQELLKLLQAFKDAIAEKRFKSRSKKLNSGEGALKFLFIQAT